VLQCVAVVAVWCSVLQCVAELREKSAWDHTDASEGETAGKNKIGGRQGVMETQRIYMYI